MSESNPVLAEVLRAGISENRHRGRICVADSKGAIIYEAGDIRENTFPRSALKFFQAIPVVSEGAHGRFGFSEEELTVMCASHNGEPEHLAAVRGILHKTGIDEDYLKCGAHEPMHRESARHLHKSGASPAAIHNNCSGKHSGFLALSKYMSVSPENYLDLNHPVQECVRKCVSEFCEIEQDRLLAGKDGCSAPNYAMPLYHLALGFARLADPASADAVYRQAVETIAGAVSKHPFYLAGTGRYCTELVSHSSKKVIGKLGAEGVYAAFLPGKGIGIAVKIDDGTTGMQYVAVQHVLNSLGILNKSEKLNLEKYRRHPLLNARGLNVGEVRPAESWKIPDKLILNK